MKKDGKPKKIKEKTSDRHIHLPDSIWKSIEKEAAQEGRTVTGQVRHVFTIRYQTPQPEGKDHA